MLLNQHLPPTVAGDEWYLHVLFLLIFRDPVYQHTMKPFHLIRSEKGGLSSGLYTIPAFEHDGVPIQKYKHCVPIVVPWHGCM